MPAFKIVGFLTILIALASVGPALANPSTREIQLSAISAPAKTSSLGGALYWLASNRSSTGSYGAYQEHMTAAAAYALWLNDTHSPAAALSYSWLANQMNSSSSWFWSPYPEADVPGAILYSIASSSNLPLINQPFVDSNLLQLQLSNGGFEGYFDSKLGTVTSSVDTDMAILGLINAKSIPASNQTNALNYLKSLQNPDGSFNLTRTTSFDPIYSLGPDPVSITAVTLLALESAGYASSEPHVSMALNFLVDNAASGFGKGHVYAAAVTSLALKAYDQPDSVVTSIAFLLSQQNCDGGFSDLSRSSYPQSNALDTGWVVAALETQFQGGTRNVPVNSPRVNCSPTAAFSFSPRTPTAAVAVHFDATPSSDADSDRLSYNWTFGDGSYAQGVNPVHIFTSSGNFTVTLVVSDSQTSPGPLSNTKSEVITVLPIQQSVNSPTGVVSLLLIGAVGLVAALGIGFYFGRKTGRRPMALVS